VRRYFTRARAEKRLSTAISCTSGCGHSRPGSDPQASEAALGTSFVHKHRKLRFLSIHHVPRGAAAQPACAGEGDEGGEGLAAAGGDRGRGETGRRAGAELGRGRWSGRGGGAGQTTGGAGQARQAAGGGADGAAIAAAGRKPAWRSDAASSCTSPQTDGARPPGRSEPADHAAAARAAAGGEAARRLWRGGAGGLAGGDGGQGRAGGLAVGSRGVVRRRGDTWGDEARGGAGGGACGSCR
jgi:hypothetical protein